MAQDAASSRTRPIEYLAKARCPSSECVGEPDLELTHIFATREAGAKGGTGEQQDLHDATSPHRSDASSIPVDPTAAPEYYGGAPLREEDEELELDDGDGMGASFHFSPILSSPTDLNAELGLTASVAMLSMGSHVEARASHAVGSQGGQAVPSAAACAGGISSSEAPTAPAYAGSGGGEASAEVLSPTAGGTSRLSGQRSGTASADCTPSALAHVPGTPPPHPPSQLYSAGSGCCGYACPPGSASLAYTSYASPYRPLGGSRRSPAGFSLFNFVKPRTPPSAAATSLALGAQPERSGMSCTSGPSLAAQEGGGGLGGAHAAGLPLASAVAPPSHVAEANGSCSYEMFRGSGPSLLHVLGGGDAQARERAAAAHVLGGESAQAPSVLHPPPPAHPPPQQPQPHPPLPPTGHAVVVGVSGGGGGSGRGSMAPSVAHTDAPALAGRCAVRVTQHPIAHNASVHITAAPLVAGAELDARAALHVAAHAHTTAGCCYTSVAQSSAAMSACIEPRGSMATAPSTPPSGAHVPAAVSTACAADAQGGGTLHAFSMAAVGRASALHVAGGAGGQLQPMQPGVVIDPTAAALLAHQQAAQQHAAAAAAAAGLGCYNSAAAQYCAQAGPQPQPLAGSTGGVCVLPAYSAFWSGQAAAAAAAAQVPSHSQRVAQPQPQPQPQPQVPHLSRPLQQQRPAQPPPPPPGPPAQPPQPPQPLQPLQQQQQQQQQQPGHSQQPQAQPREARVDGGAHPSASQPATSSAAATVPPPPNLSLSFGAEVDGGGAGARVELAMSPHTRTLYKDFCAMLRFKETQGEGVEALSSFVNGCLGQLPGGVHWRVHLELADLSKREQHFREARHLYQRAAELQPNAPQPWLEHAKMEEERGHFARCGRILTVGLSHCPHNESLLLKAIKHHERMGDTALARSLLGRLLGVGVDRAWRALLEGALLEARTSNLCTARRVFKYLLHHAPWCGPVWYEVCRFEQRCERHERALALAEQGLAQLPRYGPLWFQAMRLLECVAQPPQLLVRARALVTRGARCISKDLVWKLWFEFGRLEERAGSLAAARAAYVQAVLACPANLRWKVWLGGARTELAHAHVETARALLQRAMLEAPAKVRGAVRLECARLLELCGDFVAARAELRAARRECGHEWKVYLEAILLEVRAEPHNTARALREARHALGVHTGTGRLWAALIQLRPRFHATDAALSAATHPAGQPAAAAAAEGAVDTARSRHAQAALQLRVFCEALQEVPKSGEVWCEGARICMDPTTRAFNPAAARRFLEFAIEFTPQYGDSFVEYLRLLLLLHAGRAELARLVQLCVNAEPNYGTLWFHCKRSLLLSTRQVLVIAQQLLIVELRQHASVYEAAMRQAGFAGYVLSLPPPDVSILPAELSPPNELLEDSAVLPGDFTTGSLTLNRMIRRVSSLSFEQRRALIYGGDQLVP